MARAATLRSFSNKVLNPFGRVLPVIIGLVGANAGALIGLLAFRLRQKRAPNSVPNNSAASSIPPQEWGDMPVKQFLQCLIGINAATTLGWWNGAFGGLVYLVSPTPGTKGEVSMGIFLIFLWPFKLLLGLYNLVVSATAGGVIGALLWSLFSVLRRTR